MTLTGEKVYLRPFEESDLELTHAWVNNPEIMDTLSLHGPISRKQQQVWFENLCRDPSKIVFAICLKDSHEHVGNVSLRNIDPLNRNAMFSIFLGTRQHRSQGIGKEATVLMLEHAFVFMNLHRIYLKTTSSNESAIAMYEKIGFIREGCMRQHEFKNGKYVDKLLFGILKTEFSA